MTTYKPWTPPPGVGVVPPPVHPETTVDVIYSDRSEGSFLAAGNANWSAVGDGPSIVAYAVVEEYVEPKVARERYLCVLDTGSEAVLLSHEIDENGWTIGENAFLMREVLPADPSREVVAWAVVTDEGVTDCSFIHEHHATNYRTKYGGTVVRLSGVMPS